MSLSKVQTATYLGVTFLVDSADTTGGRKTVTHEYPNTNRREVEDLGELQNTFTLNGFVHGDDYAAQRDSLIAALTQPGRGQLTHPFFGTVTVVPKPFSVSESFTTFGIARFTMTFEKADELAYPTVSLNNTSLINLKSSSLNDLVGNDLANIFNVTKKYPANFLSGQGILIQIGNVLGINANNVLKVTNEVSSFTNKITSWTKDINSNINNPSQLATDFTSLFDSFSLIGLNPSDQFDLLSSLFLYGSSDAVIPATTVQLAEREKNRQIINSAVNINVLSNAYNTVPQLTFTTEDDIQNVQNILTKQFEYVMNNNNVSDDTIQALKDTHVEVVKFLEQQLVNTFKISTILSNEISMTLLCFSYYGSVDNTNDLISLNSTVDSSFVSGEVKILTQ